MCQETLPRAGGGCSNGSHFRVTQTLLHMSLKDDRLLRHLTSRTGKGTLTPSAAVVCDYEPSGGRVARRTDACRRGPTSVTLAIRLGTDPARLGDERARGS